MRRPQLLLLVAAAALAAAACTSASEPGWTYAPPTPSPTPGPSVEAPSGEAPSGEAPSGEAPSGEAPSGGAGGDTVQISALNIAFEQTEVAAPADTPFTIAFDNKEAVPHNVEIKDASGVSVFKGDIVTGPTVVNYEVPALPAGTYQFVCTVHPNMVGTLTAG
jgi:plastocyanin